MRWVILAALACADMAGAEDRLDNLLKDLQSTAAAKKIRAAEEIGRMGADGAAAGQLLCFTALSKDQGVRAAALDAMEKVCPKCHRIVVTLVVDEQKNNIIAALKKMAELNDEGFAALPAAVAILESMKPGIVAKQAKEKDMVVPYALTACLAVAPTHRRTIGVVGTYLGIGRGTKRLDLAGYRFDAIHYIADALQANPKGADKWMPLIIEALGDDEVYEFREPSGAVMQETVAMMAAKAAASLGPAAGSALPTLKKMKLHKHQPLRDAAIDAVSKIEK